MVSHQERLLNSYQHWTHRTINSGLNDHPTKVDTCPGWSLRNGVKPVSIGCPLLLNCDIASMTYADIWQIATLTDVFHLQPFHPRCLWKIRNCQPRGMARGWPLSLPNFIGPNSEDSLRLFRLTLAFLISCSLPLDFWSSLPWRFGCSDALERQRSPMNVSCTQGNTRKHTHTLTLMRLLSC